MMWTVEIPTAGRRRFDIFVLADLMGRFIAPGSIWSQLGKHALDKMHLVLDD